MHKVFCFFVLLFYTGTLWARPPVRVASIGDSVTEGAGLENPEKTAYPAVLQHLLGKAYEVKNFGHSGATLLRQGHNPYAETQQLQDALAFNADVAVIHLGLNDTDPRNFPHYRDQFVADYLWLIDTLRANNPHLQVFICKMSPIFTGHPRFTSSTFNWYHQVQELIAQVAEAAKLPVFDFYTALHNRPDLFTDKPTLHPNRLGAAQIAKIVQQHITGDFGGLQLPPVFGRFMVVQRDKPFRIWGIADAGTIVEVFGDPQDVHPREKLAVGRRLAQWAMHQEYGLNITPSGPLFQDFAPKNNHIEIRFDYGEGLATSDGQTTKGFAFHTLDGRSIPAIASIRHDKILVEKPVGVALKALVYGWDPVSKGNLINEANLPASTFRIELNKL